ncbi:rhodanese-like domain-containing protein [Meridianimarinicoccus sp. MJW13]|uniref:rhodanese-like domain-containing protein n=1 Tax=Meridianimarinicoccus sp. MJW13 TaxID=2720031 RepID=UPI001865B380|nr:rhodanese-like domain-containing protein [Fluviibacterium sp. MJW13]
MTRFFTALALCLATTPLHAADLEVGITSAIGQVEVPGTSTIIQRNQDTEAQIEGEFARTSRACPPFCIQPMTPAEGVTTIGELELLDMLQDPEAVVVDSRVADWYRRGTIPGTINIPYTQIVDHLGELGCEIDFDGWDCENAKPVALFCNGSWCGQSPAAIRQMVGAGFPADRIFYYRGGMQAWQMLGLTVTGGS